MPLDQKASFLLIIFFLMSSLLVINFLLLSPVTDFLQSKVAEDETAKDTQPAKTAETAQRVQLAVSALPTLQQRQFWCPILMQLDYNTNQRWEIGWG